MLTIILVLTVGVCATQCAIVDYQLVVNMILRLKIIMVVHYSCPLLAQKIHETASECQPQAKHYPLSAPIY